MKFKGKLAIVTGGTRGIGYAIANLLWQLGADVIATGTKIENQFKNKKRFKFVRLNFLDAASVESFKTMVRKLNKVDVLVNNAGINIIEPIDKIGQENWDKIIRVNLTGPMLLSREVSLLMMRAKKGKILNVSSIWGVISKEKRDAYSASKTGILGLTRAMALDLASHNILVNALSPGFTMTELTKSTLTKAEIDSLAKEVPLKRFADVKEMAKTAVFLCSEDNTYITGQNIIVDGGFTIR